MQINISEIIVEALFKHDKVNLPGVGSFEIKYDGAAFNPGKKSIKPPSSTIVFSEKHHESSEMLGLLMDRYSLSEKKALKVLNNFSNQVLNGFLNYDKVLIKNFGVLQRGTDGKVHFEASSFLNAWLKESLPELEVQHIIKDPTTKQPKDDPQIKHTSIADANDQRSTIRDSNIEQKTPKAELVNADSKPIVKEQKVEKDFVQKKNTPIQKEIEPVDYSDYDEGRNLAWLIPLVFTLLLIGGIVYGVSWYNNNNYQSSKKKSQDSMATSMDTSIHPEEKMLDAEVQNAEDGAAAVASNKVQETANPEECIIIVGSYRNESNITDIIYKIKEKGLTTYTEKYGPYIRVGFKFACAKVDLKEYISEVRSQLGDQSWYLVPNVEY